MDLWLLLLIVCVAGAVGGLVNSLVTGEGLLWPNRGSDGVLHPGWVGNVVTGTVAAGVSWGLYGPFSAASILGPQPAGGTPAIQFSLSLSALIGAFLVGMSGAKWLTTEVSKRTERATTDALAAKAMPAADVQKMQTASAKTRFDMVNEALSSGSGP